MTWATGIHADIDIDIYHSQKVCDGPSISSTGLRQIVSECPARFYAYSDFNPKKKVKTSEALSFGRAAHALMLGEPEFNAKFIISPYDTFTTNAARAWRDAQTKQVVRATDMVTIHEMCAAQKASHQCARAFKKGAPEKSIIWQHEPTKLWLKARPDWMPDDLKKEFCVEYKTAASIRPRTLGQDAFKFGYHMQAAMVVDGLVAVTGEQPLGVAHAIQEKEAPYLCEMKFFTTEQIDLGRREYLRALAILAECLASGKWPGWTDEPEAYESPYHIQKKIEEEHGRDSDEGSDGGYGDEF